MNRTVNNIGALFELDRALFEAVYGKPLSEAAPPALKESDRPEWMDKVPNGKGIGDVIRDAVGEGMIRPEREQDFRQLLDDAFPGWGWHKAKEIGETHGR